MTAKSEPGSPINMPERNGTVTEGEQQPLNMVGSVTVKSEDRGHPERKRRLSNESLDVSFFFIYIEERRSAEMFYLQN